MVRPVNYFPLHEIKICGVRYAVSEVKDLRDDTGERRFYGKISHVNLHIEIEEEMAREVKIQSALHESLHGLFHHTGNYDIDQEERIVQMLGCQIPQFLRENRQLVDLIMGEQKHNPNCAYCTREIPDAPVIMPKYPYAYFCTIDCSNKFDLRQSDNAQ